MRNAWLGPPDRGTPIILDESTSNQLSDAEHINAYVTRFRYVIATLDIGRTSRLCAKGFVESRFCFDTTRYSHV
jgi:hypothetical protein